MSFDKIIDITKIKVISFDLDNTLYDNTPVIKKAEKESQQYLSKEFSKQNKIFDVNQYISVRKELIRSNNVAFDNLTYLRQECLTQVCIKLQNSELIIEKATKIFIDLRQEAKIPVEINKMIEKLSKCFILVSMTNGNCDAKNLSVGQYFDKNYSPQQGYRAKPHAEMYEKVMTDFNIKAEEILHVGDEGNTDGLGANNAGCQFLEFRPFEKNITNSVNKFIAFFSLIDAL